jgi:hypothetical protein
MDQGAFAGAHEVSCAPYNVLGDLLLIAERRGGMYHGYRVQHEKVIWDART